jgi:hypothetical protein
MGALGTGPLQQTVTAGVAIPSVFAWPLANRVMTSSGTTTAPLGNAAFQFDVSGTRVLFMGAGSSQSWANVGNLGDANTDRITASWAANLWTLKSEATGTGTVRSMKIDAGTATLTLNASAGLTFTSTSISITSESGGTGHNLTINGNNSDSLLSSSQWDAVTFLTTHNSSIVANNTMTVTGSPTLASATSLVADAVKLSAGITLTGTTAVTTATGLNAVVVPRPGIVLGNAGSVTISFAASVYIANAPLAGTGIIITNGYALWVDAGSVRIDGSVALGGGAAATLGTIGGSGPTAAAQAKWIPLNSDGTQYFVAAWS